MTTHTEMPHAQLATSKSADLGKIVDLGEDPIVLGLKQLYDSVLDEPVPDDFLALLGQIDASLAEKTTSDEPSS